MYYLGLGIGNLIILGAIEAFLPGVKIDSTGAILGGALVLTLLNILIRPLLLLVLLPINILTLGIFSLLVNTWMVMLADKLVPGMVVGGFWNALLIALLAMMLMKFMKNWRYKREGLR